MKKLLPALIVFIVLLFLYALALLVFVDPDVGLELDHGYLVTDGLRFGKDFYFGAATSAYQVEGNCTNCNWYAFESAVDSLGHPRIARGQRSGLAADHWNRYKEDVQLLKELHLNAYRFSVEWSKIEPEEGVFIDSVLDHYERVVDELRANRIEPFVTLHHFTNPLWFERKGGFEQRDSPEIFARFAGKVAQRLGSKVRFWCTINEPNIYAVEGYYFGTFPPAQHDPAKTLLVFRNMLRAHTACYQAIKAVLPDARVGLVNSMFVFDPPQRWNLSDIMLAYYLNKTFNTSVIEYLRTGVFDVSLPGVGSEHFDSGVTEAFDFVGVNYYSRLQYHLAPFSKEKFILVQNLPRDQLTDKGWEIYKEGLFRALRMVSSQTSKPIYITENGIADDSDQKRAGFIEDHIMTANRAVFEGMNVKGYFYWSLMDNFEWTDGFDTHFGLYAVDYATQKRTLRPGSLKYKEIATRWSRWNLGY